MTKKVRLREKINFSLSEKHYWNEDSHEFSVNMNRNVPDNRRKKFLKMLERNVLQGEYERGEEYYLNLDYTFIRKQSNLKSLYIGATIGTLGIVPYTDKIKVKLVTSLIKNGKTLEKFNYFSSYNNWVSIFLLPAAFFYSENRAEEEIKEYLFQLLLKDLKKKGF